MPEEQLILTIYIFAILYASALVTFVAIFIPRINKARSVLFNAKLTEMKMKYDQELLQSQVEIQTETLTILGRELHDNIGQKIYVARLQLSSLMSDPGTVEDAMKILNCTLEEAAGDLHGLLKNFSLDLIVQGNLKRAIEALVAKLERTGAFKLTYRQEGTYESLRDEEEIFVFRIFQEAINNIIRHADALSIEINFRCSPEWVTLSVRDDGKGFNVSNTLDRQDLLGKVGGLSSMQKRASLINAKINIVSDLDVGSRISLRVPVKSVENE